MSRLLDNVYHLSKWIVLTIWGITLGISLSEKTHFLMMPFERSRIALYPQILVSFSIFFGFVLASLSLIISISNNSSFIEFRTKNNSAEGIWDSFLGSLKYLGIGCLLALLLITLDSEKPVVPEWALKTLKWISIFVFLKITEKLFWSFVLLYLLIETIKESWKTERKEFQKLQKDKLYAQKKE